MFVRNLATSTRAGRSTPYKTGLSQSRKKSSPAQVEASRKKATPIREGVIVISKSTTMDQLQEFAQKAEQKFGIKAIQIHMHKDEGHQGSQEWKPNLHAHIVFD